MEFVMTKDKLMEHAGAAAALMAIIYRVGSDW